MKKFLLVLIIVLTIFTFIGCDQLMGTNTSSSSSSSSSSSTTSSNDYDIYIYFNTSTYDHIVIDRTTYSASGSVLDSNFDQYISDGSYHYTWYNCSYDELDVYYHIKFYDTYGNYSWTDYQWMDVTKSNPTYYYYY